MARAVNPDKAKAEYRNGLLKIMVPVAEEGPAMKIEVEVAQVG